MPKNTFWRFVGTWASPLAASLLAFYVFVIFSYLRTISTGSPSEPGQGMAESIARPFLHHGEPLQLKVSTSVDQTECSVYVQRAIINSDGKIVFQKIYVIGTAHLERMAKSEATFSIQLPDLPPAKYYYKADVYLNCIGGRSYVRDTGLIPFEIID